MGILHDLLAAEVYPALGCTEPIACAYAAALAAAELGAPVEGVSLTADPGTFKNGAAVTVPHSGGARGNLVAAVLGALAARPELKLEVLKAATPEMLARAGALQAAGACRYRCLPDVRGFRVEATVFGGGHEARCVLAGGHTSIVLLERDGKILRQADINGGEGEGHAYRAALREMPLRAILEESVKLDEATRRELKRGVEMNLAMAEHGAGVRGVASQLRRMHESGLAADDIFHRTKILVASAVDARMAGLPYPVMTSGGSGNQGIVASLTPWSVGTARGVPEARILESIAAAHAVNAYVKSFTGELSVICGCAMAAGIAAAVAIVYQQAGLDMAKITCAVGNVAGDLGGLICDGAKPGCAVKSVTSVDAAMRAAFMALDSYGVSGDDGVVGHTVEESVRNLGRISLEGMFPVDATLLDILEKKSVASGRA